MTMEKLIAILKNHGWGDNALDMQDNGKLHCYCWIDSVTGAWGYDVLEIRNGKFFCNGKPENLKAWLGY